MVALGTGHICPAVTAEQVKSIAAYSTQANRNGRNRRPGFSMGSDADFALCSSKPQSIIQRISLPDLMLSRADAWNYGLNDKSGETKF
jgi:hypothetical protein